MTNGFAGRNIASYRPGILSAHRIINDLLGAKPVQAFPPTAIIVQVKDFPDVSYYQLSIDWEKMRSKTDSAIIRAGHGIWKDKQFERNWAEAKRQGMKRGIYIFFDDRYDPGRQAAFLYSLIEADLPEMEIWIDWEISYGGAFGGLKNVVALMQAIEAKIPSAKVGLYTGYYWFRDHSNPITNASQYRYLKTRPLWLAFYASAELVKIPQPWTNLLLWQYGTPAFGAAYGVQSIEIDMNFFNGSEEDFAARYGGIPNPPPNGGILPTWYRVNTLDGLKIREGGGTNYSQIGSLEYNEKVETVEEPVGGWLHISRILRNSGILEAPPNPSSWCYGGLCVKVESPLPDPTPSPASYLCKFEGTVTLTDPNGAKYSAPVSFDILLNK